VADSDDTADGDPGDEPLHVLVGPLDTSRRIDGDDGILHAVDHGFEFSAAFGGVCENAVDVIGCTGDGASQLVEVLIGLVGN